MWRTLISILFVVFITVGQAFAALPTEVASIDPANGATGVSTGPTITVMFSVAMSSSTITTSTLYLKNASNQTVSGGTVSYTSGTRTAMLTFPSGTLALNSNYTIYLSRNIKTLGGTNINGNSNYSGYSFTTTTDDSPPTVVSVVPVSNATGVALTAVIDVTFSDFIDIATLTSSTLLVNGGVTPASIAQYGGAASKTYRYTPSANLAYNTLYTVTLKGGAAGIANTAVPQLSMSNDYSFSFRTLLPDTTPPTIISVTPAAAATSIALDTTVTATFSEPMTPEGFTTNTFTLTDSSGASISGSVGYNTTTQIATFTPDSPLLRGTVYTATVTTGVTDQAGNHLSAAKSWSFTTTGSYAVNAVPLNNYCQIPPFVTSGSNALKPNVLLIVDNSGSMNEFSYKAVGKGGGINNKDTSYNANSTYTGYFDYGKMYSYSTSAGGYFYVDGVKTLDKTSFWSGNFLNWLTMRKIDLVRKVLVGGKTQPRSANVANYLFPTSNSDRDYYKGYGSGYYVVDDKIYVCSSSSCGSYSATYNLKVYVGDQLPQEGLLLQMQDRINFGIVFFNDGYRFEDGTNSVKDGGYVAVDIGSTGTNLITQVENTDPTTWTPLAETFYETTRYFEATASAYNGGTYSGKDPLTASCMKNFVLILTDGESTKDRNVPGTSFSHPSPIAVSSVDGNFNVQTYMGKIAANEGTPARNWSDSSKISSEGSWYLPGVALWAHTTDLRSATVGKSNLAGLQNLTTYVVYAFDDNANAREMLKLTAKYGGFEDAAMTSSSLPDSAGKWDVNGDGVPDTYYEAQQGGQLQSALQNAFNDILAKVSSGTSASIVNNRGESGANLFQAVFYPKKSFGTSDLYWIGELQNMWYYLDPLLSTSSIREDTNFDGKLDLKADNKVTIDYDTTKNQTVANWYRDTTGTGGYTFQATGSPDNIHALWRAGGLLHNRTAASRAIKTTLNSYNPGYLNSSHPLAGTSDSGLTAFSAANGNVISDYLNVSDVATGNKIIDYVRGVDYTTDPSYRSRTVTINYPNTNPTPLNASISGVWKLGDIVASTPQPQTSKQLNAFDTAYKDNSYSLFYNSADYQARNMVYTAANDGMMHAFRVGKVARTPYDKTAPNRIAQITNLDNSLYLGDEEWAYVPKNALPYLKYLGDPSYNHLFYVNNTVTLVDASINRPSDTTSTCTQEEYWKCDKKTYSDATTKILDQDKTSWRTVLIGGMGLGGASRDYAGFCNKADGSTPASVAQETRLDCVKSPITGAGLSSFFALDITTPQSPKFMWEFSDAVLPSADKGLGYTTSGPAVVRISARNPAANNHGTPDLRKNGRWFAVFATGPSGPIDTAVHQFRGRSDNRLKVYVVDMHPDMANGWVKGTNYWVMDSGIDNAFAGDLTDTVIDVDRWNSSANGHYSDDSVYIGFTKPKAGTSPVEWTDGGILRLLTNDSLNPADWTLSTLIDGIGPVTSSPTKLQDRNNKKLWLLFGTGRYFYKDTNGQDDPGNLRHLFGVMETCYDGVNNKMNSGFDSSGALQGCARTAPAALGFSDLQDQSATIVANLPAGKKGWYITLDPVGNYALGAQMTTAAYDAERVVTNTTAAFNGVVYFTTFKPTNDLCGYGGATMVWMVDYLNGGVPPASTMKGKLLVQLSGGEFMAIDIATATKSGGDATQQTRGDRRIRADLAGHGIAGGRGGSLQSLSQPVRKILHIMEK